MKNKLFFLFCIFVISISFTLTSCHTWAGEGSKKNASTLKNGHGVLLTKTPTNFDDKFGYEVLIYQISPDSTEMTSIKVFVPKNTWDRLPEPDDDTDVNIEYIENIEYGDSESPSSLLSFWDFQFNLCVGYTIDTLSIKK